MTHGARAAATYLGYKASSVPCGCCGCFEQDVAALEVAVHHIHGVQVGQSRAQLLGSGQHPQGVAAVRGLGVHEHATLQH